MYLMTCTRPDLAYPLSILARYVAPGRHRLEHMAAAKRVLRYLCSYAAVVIGLHLQPWLRLCFVVVYPLIFYNKAMLALCREHRQEHGTKHIALRYFLARELRQRGQLRLAYVASQANTADIFTKALPPGDHQCFCTMLGLLALLSLTGLVTSCSPPLCLWGLYYLYPTHFASSSFLILSHFTLVTSATALPFPLSSVPRTPPPPMYITLYYLVTRLLGSRCSSVSDLFLSLCPTELTVNLLEERLAAAEKSILAVGASRGDHRTPFFEGCSPVPLLPSVASAAAVNLVGTEEVGAASAPSGRCRNSKGKGSKGGGGGGEGSSGGGGGGRGGGGGGGGGTGSGGVSGGGGGRGGGGGGGGGSGSGGGGGGGGGAGRGAAAQRGGFGGSQRQHQLRTRETPSVQQLREWYVMRGRSGGAGPCTYVLRTGTRSREVCGLPHTAQSCFCCLTDAWRTQFPDAVELPRWHDLLLQNVPIFDLDFDAILAAMYALADSADGDCYLSVPPDPGIAAATLGASASAAPGVGASVAPGAGASATPGAGAFALSVPAPTESLHTFTLDSGASRSFFRDSTTLTPLRRLVAVSLSDPSGGPVLAHSSTVLPCPAAPSGLLSGLHLPSFSTNLVSGADLQDAWVDQFTPGAASNQVFAAASRSSPASAPCSCRPLSHETLLWHHRLGHPSLPRLRGMASHALVSGLLRSLPPLPPGPAPTYGPCVEGRQRAAPHSSWFPPTEAPLQTLHMDVWGPARVCGQGHERYFLLVVDDYSRYTTVFPLRSKGEVPEVLIDWIRGARRQLSESFGSDLHVLRLHSDRGGEFSSDLLRAFCRSEGIRQTFTLPASPQQNGIAERRIGMVMDVARTSMIHAAAPHFLWPFAVQYATHQISLLPRVSLPETTPTLRWTGKVGNASAFRVLGSRAFVRDTTADKLSSRAVPCVFLGFLPDAPGWQFYHPTSRRVLSSQDVTFDESVSYYLVFPYRTASLPPPPLFLAPGAPPVDPLPPQGLSPSGVSKVDPAEPVEVAFDSGVPSGGAASGGALGVPLRGEPLSPQQLCEWYSRRGRGAAGAGAAGGAAGSTGSAPGAGGVAGAGAAGGAVGARAAGGAARAGATGGAAGAGATGGASGAGAAGGAAGAGAAGGAAGAGAAGGAAGAGAAGGAAGARAAIGAAGTGAAGGAADTGDPGAEGTGSVSAVSGGAARPRPYYVPLIQQPASPLPGPSPYSGPTRGLMERREPESRPVSPESRSASPLRPVCTSRVPRPRPPPVPGTHSMTLRPSSAPQRVPLPSPPASSLPTGPDPASDSLSAACLAVSRFLATGVTEPLFESSAASALVAELVDFAAACHLDCATCLVAESVSASVCPPSVRGECALSMDVLEDRQEEFECFAASVPHLVSMLIAPDGDPDAVDIPTPRSYAEAIEGPYSSQWHAAMDAEMASWKSTGTYVEEVPPPGANIVSGMWIFRVKRPPGSPPVFKARYVARGFSQRQGVDFFQTFSPTPKMTTLRVLLHVAAQRDYELHSLDFSTAFLQGSLHEEIWLRRPPGFTGSFPAGTQWSLWRPVYGLCQAPREWHDTLRMTLAALGFAPSTSDPSLFLRTNTTLPPFYVLVYVDDLVFATADTEALAHVMSEMQKRHTCTDLGPSALRLHLLFAIVHSSAYRSLALSSVEPSGLYPELVGCLMYLMTCTQSDLAYPLSLLARYVAPGRHRKGYTFSLGSGSVSWRSTRSSSVLSSSCEAETYAGAMATQELRWLTYLLTDLGEAPCSPPILTKQIALRYFLARELQQRGQLRIAYVASQANTADVFTKALQPCDHQRFCTVLGLVPTVPHLLTS
ncbi:unnamed protein product [Closterium sp. NIES-53]